ncbi:MAG: hypothetical protein ACK5YR_03925 [Pirellula sp.]|jgi:hypothetical protein
MADQDVKLTKQGDVSYGPACFVTLIFLLVGISLFFVYMSIVLMGNTGERASRAIYEQLIPWVEQSHLSQNDRRDVIDELELLAEKMKQEELTSRQLSRLNARLSDSAILQWGAVQKLDAAAQESDMSDEEKAEFTSLCDRWFACAASGKLSLQEMEFAMQQVCTKDARTGRLNPKTDAPSTALRDFMRRVKTMCDHFKTPTEKFGKKVPEVLRQMIEDGLDESK